METEEQIVYQLLEPIRASNLNNDEVVGEREIRAYMRSHRARIIEKNFRSGNIIPDNVFQSLGPLTVPSHVDPNNAFNYFLDPLPLKPIIYLNKNKGIRVWSYDQVNSVIGKEINVVDYDYYIEHRRHPIYKHQPICTYKGNSLLIYSGDLNINVESKLTINDGASLNGQVSLLVDGQGKGGTAIKVNVEAILLNPDDGLSYDWTISPYPLPAEQITELKRRILRTEFNLILQTTSDEVTDNNSDVRRRK